MKKKITKQDIETMIKEIKEFLANEGLECDICIYYNNGRDISSFSYKTMDTEWKHEEDVSPHDYFEYAATKHILSMSFEGALNHLLNGYDINDVALEKFNEIFEKYGLMYELGNSWNLTAFPIKDNIEDYEYTDYEDEDEENYPEASISLRNEKALENLKKTFPELVLVMTEWHRASKLVGDKGSCVIGAGLEFEYKGIRFFMDACSPWQGSVCKW